MASRGTNVIYILQEFCEKFKLPAPIYEFKNGVNNNCTSFTVVSKVANLQGIGTAFTKAEAKCLAAENILIQLLELKRSTDAALSKSPNNEVGMWLCKYCTKFEVPHPKYEIKTISMEKDGESVQSFEAVCVIGSKLFSASAPDREEALRLAARNAFRFLLAEDDNIITLPTTHVKYVVKTISMKEDGESVQSFKAVCVTGSKLFSVSAPDREEALRFAVRNAIRFILAKYNNNMTVPTAHVTATQDVIPKDVIPKDEIPKNEDKTALVAANKDHDVLEKYQETIRKKKADEDKAPECQASHPTKFPMWIKKKALHIISQNFGSKEKQALEILSALQLEYKPEQTSYEGPGQMKFSIEVKNESWILFTGNSKDDLYMQLISYCTQLLHYQQSG